MFFCCVERRISWVNVFDRPLGPKFSRVQRSISSVEICWLDFSVFIVRARWGMLKNASWLKNRLVVCSFLGGKAKVVCARSFDKVIPRIVIISAMSFTIMGIVVMGEV